MAVTVRSIYQSVCWVLLEDPGLTLGIVTEDTFLKYFSDAVFDFLNKTRLEKKIFTEQVDLGTGKYPVPDDISEVEDAFIAGRLIEQTTAERLGYEVPNWRTATGPTQAWHVDGLPIKSIEIVPLPYWQGAEIPGPQPPYGTYGDFFPGQRNLTLVGPASTLQTAFALGDPIPVIQDSFAVYLGYYVLERIFSSDTEGRDDQRAAYCHARYKEGIALARALSAQFLMDEFAE